MSAVRFTVTKADGAGEGDASYGTSPQVRIVDSDIKTGITTVYRYFILSTSRETHDTWVGWGNISVPFV